MITAVVGPMMVAVPVPMVVERVEELVETMEPTAVATKQLHVVVFSASVTSMDMYVPEVERVVARAETMGAMVVVRAAVHPAGITLASAHTVPAAPAIGPVQVMAHLVPMQFFRVPVVVAVVAVVHLG